MIYALVLGTSIFANIVLIVMLRKLYLDYEWLTELLRELDESEEVVE